MPPANLIIFYYSAELYTMIQFVVIQRGHKLQQLIFPEHILAEIVDCFTRMPTSVRDKDKGLLYRYLTLPNYKPRRGRQPPLWDSRAHSGTLQNHWMSLPLESRLYPWRI
jgi:hypothetical protein